VGGAGEVTHADDVRRRDRVYGWQPVPGVEYEPTSDGHGTVAKTDALALLRETSHLVSAEAKPEQAAQGATEADTADAAPVALGELLDDVVAFVRRFIVVGDTEADVIALWVLHTYVYDTAIATPYLNFWSPEPGSGKTTALDVLALIVRDGLQIDNLTEAVLFRLIDSRRPTLLIDEVDAVFGKKNSDSTEGIRQVLNSGYRKGKQAWRCVGPRHELTPFDVFCPKATAGLDKLPGTLAHRSISIPMQPPRPEDEYRDLDLEEVAAEADALRGSFESWAATADEALRDPRLKSPKLDALDARGNEIWRILFRIADLAAGDWPGRARAASAALSGRERRQESASVGLQLLADIRTVFDSERMACRALADALNAIEHAPWGGWNNGSGITTRELGKKLAPYGIAAKSIRIEGKREGNGYELSQFADAFARYDPRNRYTGTTRIVTPTPGNPEPVQEASVPVPLGAENAHGQTDVPLVPVTSGGDGVALRALVGEPGYSVLVEQAFDNGHLTQAEFREQIRFAQFIRRRGQAADRTA
jgi:hypothetical protein